MCLGRDLAANRRMRRLRLCWRLSAERRGLIAVGHASCVLLPVLLALDPWSCGSWRRIRSSWWRYWSCLGDCCWFAERALERTKEDTGIQQLLTDVSQDSRTRHVTLTLADRVFILDLGPRPPPTPRHRRLHFSKLPACKCHSASLYDLDVLFKFACSTSRFWPQKRTKLTERSILSQ